MSSDLALVNATLPHLISFFVRLLLLSKVIEEVRILTKVFSLTCTAEYSTQREIVCDNAALRFSYKGHFKLSALTQIPEQEAIL